MKWSVWGVCLVFIGCSASVQARNPEIVPAPLGTCNGTSWSSLVLGRTTVRDIKKQFKTSRSDLPMSQELSQPKEAPQKIFALFADKHDDSPLSALLLRYSGSGPNLAELSKALGTPLRNYYQTGRLEDWKLVTFPGRGIVAFELNEGGHNTVPLLMVCPPAAAAAVCRELQSSVQPVTERRDPHANDPRVMLFGSAFVRADLKGLELSNGERQAVERTMIDTTAGGTMRYVVGAPGSYETNVSGDFNSDRGGSLSVTSTISGLGPYGLVTGSGSSSKSLPAAKDLAGMSSGINSTYYTVALNEALEKASASFHDAIMASGPPALPVVRAAQWQRLTDDLRERSGALALSMPPLSSGPLSASALPAEIAPIKPSLPAISTPAAPTSPRVQSLFTFQNGAQATGILLSFDGKTYTVATPKGMRRFRAAGIKSMQTLAPVLVQR